MKRVFVVFALTTLVGCQVKSSILPGSSQPSAAPETAAASPPAAPSAPAAETAATAQTPESAQTPRSAPAAAKAETPTPKGQTAPALYAEGKAAVKSGDLALALAAFKKAAKMDHQPKYYYEACATGYALLEKDIGLASSARFYCHYAGVYMPDKKLQNAAFDYATKIRLRYFDHLKQKDGDAFRARVEAAVHAIYGGGLTLTQDPATKQLRAQWGEVTAEEMQGFIRDFYEPGIGAHVLLDRSTQLKLCKLVATFVGGMSDYLQEYCIEQFVASYMRPQLFFDGKTTTKKPLDKSAKLWLPRPDGTYAVNVAFYGKRPDLSLEDKIKLARHLKSWSLRRPASEAIDHAYDEVDKELAAVKERVQKKYRRTSNKLMFTAGIVDEYAFPTPIKKKVAACSDLKAKAFWPKGNGKYAGQLFANGKLCDEYSPGSVQHYLSPGSCPELLKVGRNRIKAKMSKIQLKRHYHRDNSGRVRSTVEFVPVKTLTSKSMTCVMKAPQKGR